MSAKIGGVGPMPFGPLITLPVRGALKDYRAWLELMTAKMTPEERRSFLAFWGE